MTEPQTLSGTNCSGDDLVDFIVARVLDHVGIEHDLGKRRSGE